MSHRIHRKERSELKVLSRHFDRGQQGAEVKVLREVICRLRWAW